MGQGTLRGLADATTPIPEGVELFPEEGWEDVLTRQNSGIWSLFSNIFLKCLEFEHLLLENLIWIASSINEPFGLLVDDYEA